MAQQSQGGGVDLQTHTAALQLEHQQNTLHTHTISSHILQPQDYKCIKMHNKLAKAYLFIDIKITQIQIC